MQPTTDQLDGLSPAAKVANADHALCHIKRHLEAIYDLLKYHPPLPMEFINFLEDLHDLS